MSKKWKACAIGLCIGLQSCGELRQLEPSMKVNQANAKEISRSFQSALDAMLPLMLSRIDLELSDRQVDIADSLDDIEEWVIGYEGSANDRIEQELKDLRILLDERLNENENLSNEEEEDAVDQEQDHADEALDPAEPSSPADAEDLIGDAGVETISDQIIVSIKSTIDPLVENLEQLVESLESVSSDGNEELLASKVLTVARMENVLQDNESHLSIELDRMRNSLAALQPNETGALHQLVKSNPVLASLCTNPNLVQDIVESIKIRGFLNDQSVTVQLTTEQIVDLERRAAMPYPYYRGLLEQREEIEKMFKKFQENMSSQLVLLETHSDLFVFAAQQQIDVQKVLSDLASDQGFESQVLELFNGNDSMEDAKHIFKTIRELNNDLGVSAAE